MQKFLEQIWGKRGLPEFDTAAELGSSLQSNKLGLVLAGGVDSAFSSSTARRGPLPRSKVTMREGFRWLWLFPSETVLKVKLGDSTFENKPQPPQLG